MTNIMNIISFIIRKATVAESNIIADLGARTFVTGFGTCNSPEDMKQYLLTNFSRETIQSQLSNKSSIFLLGYQNDVAVGYAMLEVGIEPHSVIGPKPIELVRIYVEEEVVGQGLGSALMKTCLEEAKTNGLGTIWLAVWQKNQRAIDFYKRWGFEKVGVKEFVVGSDVQDDFIMERSVELN